MLSIGMLAAGQVERYHLAFVTEEPAAYYTAAGEAPGVWMGAGADDLELRGQVVEDHLTALLDGRHPHTGETLVGVQAARTRRGRRSTSRSPRPKGVSLAMALGDTETRPQVLAAHDAAVAQALDYLERRALAARRGAQGATQIRTHGVVAAGFVHRSSRAGDPQLHTHVVAANLVRGADDRWSAIDARGLFQHARTAGFLYEAALRAELTGRLGWEWGPVRNGIAEPGRADPRPARRLLPPARRDHRRHGRRRYRHAARRPARDPGDTRSEGPRRPAGGPRCRLGPPRRGARPRCRDDQRHRRPGYRRGTPDGPTRPARRPDARGRGL